MSNTPKATSQPTQDGKPAVIPHDGSRARERAKPRRAIDAQTIAEVARLCSKLLTEAEACREIGINPATWRNWKCRGRNDTRFAELLEEFRAGRIASLITKIESAADGVNMKQPDWRAAAHLLALTDLNRFSTSPPMNQTVVPDTGALNAMFRLLDKVIASREAKQIKTVDVKQIEDVKHE